MQKNSNDPAPEFYNIYLERPKVSYVCGTSFISCPSGTFNNTVFFIFYICQPLLSLDPLNLGFILNLCLQGDADGYDLVVVDAMHKANYASRICHSCRPNCEAKYVLDCYALSSLLAQLISLISR